MSDGYGSGSYGAISGLRAERSSFQEVRSFIESGHYLGKVRKGRYAATLLNKEKMAGAALFGQPAREGVAAALWRDCKPEFVKTATIELTRFYTLDNLHPNAGTWFLTRAVAMLPPEIQMIVAFSDPSAGHHGGLYQAAGWSYLGESKAEPYEYRDANGNRIAKQTPWYAAKRETDFMKPGETPAEAERRYAAEHGWHRVSRLPKHRYVLARTRFARHHLKPVIISSYPKPGKESRKLNDK